MQHPIQTDQSNRIRRSKLAYAAWVAFMPFAALMLTIVFCALSGLPVEFAVFIAPAAALVLWLVSVAMYVAQSRQFSRTDMVALRRYVALSVLWAPVVGTCATLALTWVFSQLYRL